MGAYKNILLGVDGSDASLHACTEGMRLAGKDAKLVVVSVAPEYNGDLGLVGVADPQKLITQPCDMALNRCQEAAAKLGVQAKTICAIGQPYARLVELADDENCDLILIGTKGMTSLQYALLGSVARKVIGFSTKDVLVVPEAGRIGWDHILLATDLSANSKGAENRALELALAYHSKLSILSVMELPTCLYGEAGALGCSLPENRSKLLDDLQARATSWGITPEVMVKQGESYKIVVDTAKAVGADVIVMGSHGRTGLTRLLMGSNTEKVIGSAKCPVLVVKT
jgi:nucleotide-binding universal stress UspA family protein